MTVRQRLIPYLMGLPTGFWLIVFFAIPLVSVLSVSLMTGNPETGFTLTWHWSTFWSALKGYHTQFLRSFYYGTVSTLVALVIAYPMAYFIAFHAGRRKSTYLLIILLPFFVSYVIRIFSWQFILSDDGILLTTLRNLHLVSKNFSVLQTPFAGRSQAVAAPPERVSGSLINEVRCWDAEGSLSGRGCEGRDLGAAGGGGERG